MLHLILVVMLAIVAYAAFLSLRDWWKANRRTVGIAAACIGIGISAVPFLPRSRTTPEQAPLVGVPASGPAAATPSVPASGAECAETYAAKSEPAPVSSESAQQGTPGSKLTPKTEDRAATIPTEGALAEPAAAAVDSVARALGAASAAQGAKTVHVNGYTTKSGTTVAPYTRSSPSRR